MKIAILDPFSGIAGDMLLGALVDVGLEADWLRALPGRLGLDDVGVAIRSVQRASIACVKVDFSIPPQPHGRHIAEIRRIVAGSGAPEAVRATADAAFTAIATVEGALHAQAAERVHLHEVGAVDAILDVVGTVWGLHELGVERTFCGPVSMGDGFVRAAHGVLPVPAPATLRLLEGHRVRPGPEGSGELVTPTGAALIRALEALEPPAEYTPLRSGFGAGTKELDGRANALRITLAEAAPAAMAEGTAGPTEQLIMITADIDDMPGEYLAAIADDLRAEGALDVVLLPTIMKKGRPGMRIEVLLRPESSRAAEERLLCGSTTIGLRRSAVVRRYLPRREARVGVLGHDIRVKVVTLPDGSRRAKPEFDDVRRVALATGRPARDILRLATEAAEHG
ncbi:MAG: nickel pincer cofactor biosynthesis protein LarC [Gemmatimonadaceae bacterium]